MGTNVKKIRRKIWSGDINLTDEVLASISPRQRRKLTELANKIQVFEEEKEKRERRFAGK